jgi:hypothetical protein
MAEWHNVRYELVRNQDMESTQMPLWRSPSWLVHKQDLCTVPKNNKGIQCNDSKKTVGHGKPSKNEISWTMD